MERLVAYSYFARLLDQCEVRLRTTPVPKKYERAGVQEAVRWLVQRPDCRKITMPKLKSTRRSHIRPHWT
jgi:hypothetical protein